MGYFPPRDVATTHSCPVCAKPLHINRGCREVIMHCPACGARYPLRDYICKADPAMEKFLENIYCDRI